MNYFSQTVIFEELLFYVSVYYIIHVNKWKKTRYNFKDVDFFLILDRKMRNLENADVRLID